MARIDKSTAGSGASNVVIKRWVKQDPVAENMIIAEQVSEPQSDFVLPRQPTRDLEQLAKLHVQKMIDDAQDEIDDRLLAADAEVEAIKAAAYEEGLAQGQQEALRIAEQQKQEIAAQFHALTAELRRWEEQRDAAMEGHILRLSMEIAEKVVRVSMENDDAIFKELIKEAIEKLNVREKCIIHVNQQEYDRFFAEGSGWLSDMEQAVSFTVTANPAIPPGGLKLSSQDGEVHAGVDTRLQKIKKALLPAEE